MFLFAYSWIYIMQVDALIVDLSVDILANLLWHLTSSEKYYKHNNAAGLFQLMCLSLLFDIIFSPSGAETK